MSVEEVVYPEDSGRVEFNRDRLLEVVPNEEKGGFPCIVETLTRIGIASTAKKTVYQSCHILKKKDKYYIVHFLELFGLDGRCRYISEEDIKRRNTIAQLLENWGMLKIVSPWFVHDEDVNVGGTYVLPYSKKGEWTLSPKYVIGNPKNRKYT